MEEIQKKFWDRWSKANELQKVDIVAELTLPHPKRHKLHHADATLVNSYLCDLEEYLHDSNRKNN
jgi:hypothetical protein